MRVIFLGFILITCMGCCSVNKQFVKAVDGYTQVILPEYKTYIERDSILSMDTKRIRTQSADKFQALLDEAKKEIK